MKRKKEPLPENYLRPFNVFICNPPTMTKDQSYGREKKKLSDSLQTKPFQVKLYPQYLMGFFFVSFCYPMFFFSFAIFIFFSLLFVTKSACHTYWRISHLSYKFFIICCCIFCVPYLFDLPIFHRAIHESYSHGTIRSITKMWSSTKRKRKKNKWNGWFFVDRRSSHSRFCQTQSGKKLFLLVWPGLLLMATRFCVCHRRYVFFSFFFSVISKSDWNETHKQCQTIVCLRLQQNHSMYFSALSQKFAGLNTGTLFITDNSYSKKKKKIQWIVKIPLILSVSNNIINWPKCLCLLFDSKCWRKPGNYFLITRRLD